MTMPNKNLSGLPKGAIHLVGRSLGPLPKESATSATEIIEEVIQYIRSCLK